MNAAGTDAGTLSVDQLTVRLSGRDIVSGVSLTAAAGQITGVIGPNGSGKSTLLRAVYRHLKPAAGRIVVGDFDLWDISPAAHARVVASVPQERDSVNGITVREVVGLGRVPHQGSFRRESSEDRDAIEQSLTEVGLSDKASRRFHSLSGGEKQRVLLARCFAQRAHVFVLDEPTNHLDVAHQVQLLTLLKDRRDTCLMTLHDLGVAAAVCDELFVLSEGVIVASGPPRSVLTPELLRSVFGIRASVGTHPLTGGLQISIDYLANPGYSPNASCGGPLTQTLID
ncbi:ABC transporter ATP-binding protein [Rhodococcus sp. IEGM 1354]|uniref:ABC transporter ATP-binding protein n=1 Tax=Rhodococcus sp. IEGM 1354 TaxID=3047088 RepID=UPI0024B638C3|nr:ABC transporter ATP-binding protein [Rhodococcus sp. IEGM 1354]MDI9929709.1 ABC transporter ATP-binding protein [Rhodococcus sp. IEGM 1354]